MKQTQFSAFLRVLLVLALAYIFLGCQSDPSPSTLPPEAAYDAVEIAPATANFSQTALEFVGDLGAGWNLGNTLDAHGVSGLASETCWSQPKTTKAMMTGLKTAGIKTVRIPISWHDHVDSAITIDSAWMARVKEVVEYALDEDLYVIINIHHDNDKKYDAFYFPDTAHQANSIEFVRRIWKQIALQFRNYDEKLIFELLNEPRLVDYEKEWSWSDSDAKLVTAAKIIGEMEQAALDEIRDSGSNNTNRYVMITPYVASPDSALSSKFVLPTDTATDKQIISVHAYTPYVFAMQDPGDTTLTAAHKGEIDRFMSKLNTKFVSEGRPVIIGEYGATNKNNLADRVAWFSYYVGKAHSYGMCTVLWDNGNYQVPSSGAFNELYGFYNRTAQTWYFQTILDAIINAVQ